MTGLRISYCLVLGLFLALKQSEQAPRLRLDSAGATLLDPEECSWRCLLQSPTPNCPCLPEDYDPEAEEWSPLHPLDKRAPPPSFPFRYGKRQAVRAKRQKMPFRYGKRSPTLSYLNLESAHRYPLDSTYDES